MMKRHYSSLAEAKYDLVHDFPGGARRLAPLVGMNPGTLCNKVNADVTTHHLTVDEAVMLQHAAHDYRILYHEAAALHHVCVPLGDYSKTSDIELLELYARLHAEIGEHSVAMMAAIKDRKITAREYDECAKEFRDVVQAGYELLSRMKALIDD